MYTLQIMVDFHACSWPDEMDATSTSLAAHFDQMNNEPVVDVMSACNNHEAATSTWPPVITFSHFLPLQVWQRHAALLSLWYTFTCCSVHQDLPIATAGSAPFEPIMLQDIRSLFLLHTDCVAFFFCCMQQHIMSFASQ